MIRSFLKTISGWFGGSIETPKPAKEVSSTSRPQHPDRRSKPTTSDKPRRRRRPRKKSPASTNKSTLQSADSTPKKPWNISEFNIEPMEGKTRFHDLPLPEEVMHAISELGYQYCTPVQAASLPHALKGEDVSGRAQTGTGKTAAFLITIFKHILEKPILGERPNGRPRALILAPTRELVLQIEKDARELSPHLPCTILGVVGGMGYEQQKKVLSENPVDIVIATPGRLLDFKQQRIISLKQVEILVIDEADRMLDMGFIPDIRKIVESTPPKTERQTMLFSATLTPEIIRLASNWTRNAHNVDINPEQIAAERVEQLVYITTFEEKFTILYNLITKANLERVLVFANRRDVTQNLANKLIAYDIRCKLLSGDVGQHQRINRLEDFRSGKVRVLVATDVAGRGLHIEGVSHVVNYNLPLDPEDYVHRIGRTGRAGATGISVSFACEDDAQQIPIIEEYMGQKLSCAYPGIELLTPLPPPTHTFLPEERKPKKSGNRPTGKRGSPPGRRRPAPRSSPRPKKPGDGSK